MPRTSAASTTSRPFATVGVPPNVCSVVKSDGSVEPSNDSTVVSWTEPGLATVVPWPSVAGAEIGCAVVDE